MNPNYGQLLILALPLALIAFMMWSQRKRQREVVDFQSQLEVGQEVVTTSGLFGRITEVDETAVHLEVAPGVVVRYDRRAIGSKAA